MTPMLEQEARQHIDVALLAAGWLVQDRADEPASVLLDRIKAEREASVAKEGRNSTRRRRGERTA